MQHRCNFAWVFQDVSKLHDDCAMFGSNNYAEPITWCTAWYHYGNRGQSTGAIGRRDSVGRQVSRLAAENENFLCILGRQRLVPCAGPDKAAPDNVEASGAAEKLDFGTGVAPTLTSSSCGKQERRNLLQIPQIAPFDRPN